MDDRVGFWHTEREYAIVPLDDLNLDIEEPEPELVRVVGCGEPHVFESKTLRGSWVAASNKSNQRIALACHPDKSAAIEAHNAAAEVLNNHGGV